MSKYVDDVKIRTSDLDNYDRVKPYAYLDFFQDIAGAHATILGVGYNESKSKNIAWLLMKNKLEILNTPIPYDRLILTTWPSGQSKIDYIRDYLLTDQFGKVIARGSSQWCIVDINTHRILRTSLLDLPRSIDDKPLYQEKFVKLENFFYQNKPCKYEYKIQNSDLDHYQHTNNARYAQIIYNALPIIADYDVTNFEINYNHEAKLGEVVKVYYEMEEELIKGCGVIDSGVLSFTFLMKLKKIIK